jgi:hypothetical protein
VANVTKKLVELEFALQACLQHIEIPEVRPTCSVGAGGSDFWDFRGGGGRGDSVCVARGWGWDGSGSRF